VPQVQGHREVLGTRHREPHTLGSDSALLGIHPHWRLKLSQEGPGF
jgi:hypothetical protein